MNMNTIAPPAFGYAKTIPPAFARSPVQAPSASKSAFPAQQAVKFGGYGYYDDSFLHYFGTRFAAVGALAAVLVGGGWTWQNMVDRYNTSCHQSQERDDAAHAAKVAEFQDEDRSLDNLSTTSLKYDSASRQIRTGDLSDTKMDALLQNVLEMDDQHKTLLFVDLFDTGHYKAAQVVHANINDPLVRNYMQSLKDLIPKDEIIELKSHSGTVVGGIWTFGLGIGGASTNSTHQEHVETPNGDVVTYAQYKGELVKIGLGQISSAKAFQNIK